MNSCNKYSHTTIRTFGYKVNYFNVFFFRSTSCLPLFLVFHLTNFHEMKWRTFHHDRFVNGVSIMVYRSMQGILVQNWIPFALQWNSKKKKISFSRSRPYVIWFVSTVHLSYYIFLDSKIIVKKNNNLVEIDWMYKWQKMP